MIQSPYRRGADDGFFFGAYLTVMFFASIFSEWMPLLQLLSGAMAVCVPLTIYRFMLRYHRSLGQMGSFPMLWMQGVVIFFCGMLLAGTALVVFMKWLSPDFVVEPDCVPWQPSGALCRGRRWIWQPIWLRRCLMPISCLRP